MKNNLMRLDKFFQNRFPQYPRDLIKKLIKDETVTVNQKIIKKPYFIVSPDDQINFDETKWTKIRTRIIPNPKINPEIIYQDKNILIINKPPGLIVHPRQIKNGYPHPKDLEKTLVSGLIHYFPKIINVGDLPKIRPGIVHRLDKDTSGTMVIAKNQLSFKYLKEQFKKRLIKKEYLTVVSGQLNKKKGTLKNLILRSKNQPLKQKISFSQGKKAVLNY
ncbi:MAG TPA: RluA family pseudouridine synthase, partial [Candidatus Portnoybacteria bacterium]|nr:RluA family pseudouridine synthase [Candidatus Portnoybacteria bacterium]